MTTKKIILYACVMLATLSSCRTSSSGYSYKELAKASLLLGIDIQRKDNHKLYVESAQWIGTPYRTGGSTKQGTDCSGLTSQLYGTVYNKRLKRNTSAQQTNSLKVRKQKLKEGDLVFFSTSRSKKKVAHVGIYLKEKKFIHASTGKGVIVSHLEEEYYNKHWICGGKVK